ncbi:hypothetical protein F7725_015878 [Dissostichus mawsoni]|uniref:Uncharacterized protein n=1 Tax=Dissostichus mawsoni TaxID=36200 RepID=A0A7J5YKA5_DISMA|nr:hypothetical protein F7725_015878 [Dissostichus mawsoni]
MICHTLIRHVFISLASSLSSDEIVTDSCSTTTDTRCQCKSGTFCVPDQACEVCKRCARCKPGEEEVKKCTPFSNTECRKRDPSPTEKTPAPPSPTPASSADIVTPVCISLAILFIIIALAVWWLKRRSCETPCLKSHCDSSEIVKIPIDDPLQQRLVPLLGSEKSLKKSFDLFDEYLDVRIHNKFFRMIGVSDNHIRISENGAPVDKVYELLKNWMQRQGLKADINVLLEALLSMDQRRSAESIASAALRRGYYRHADTP